MVDEELLRILVCPETHKPLRLADEELLARLNGAIAAGKVANRGGRAVEEPLSAGLVSEDSAAIYPIVDDIPVMIVDEAIPLDQL